jgi:hypothetical protein
VHGEQSGAIFFEILANRTKLHVSSCGDTCGMAAASGPCCNITRLPCAYVASLKDEGNFTCDDIPRSSVSRTAIKTDDRTSSSAPAT